MSSSSFGEKCFPLGMGKFRASCRTDKERCGKLVVEDCGRYINHIDRAQNTGPEPNCLPAVAIPLSGKFIVGGCFVDLWRRE